MELSQMLFAGLIGFFIQYLIVFFAIRNGMERERKNQELQISLLKIIALKSGATEAEINETSL